VWRIKKRLLRWLFSQPFRFQVSRRGRWFTWMLWFFYSRYQFLCILDQFMLWMWIVNWCNSAQEVTNGDACVIWVRRWNNFICLIDSIGFDCKTTSEGRKLKHMILLINDGWKIYTIVVFLLTFYNSIYNCK